MDTSSIARTMYFSPLYIKQTLRTMAFDLFSSDLMDGDGVSSNQTTPKVGKSNLVLPLAGFEKAG